MVSGSRRRLTASMLCGASECTLPSVRSAWKNRVVEAALRSTTAPSQSSGGTRRSASRHGERRSTSCFMAAASGRKPVPVRKTAMPDRK